MNYTQLDHGISLG